MKPLIFLFVVVACAFGHVHVDDPAKAEPAKVEAGSLQEQLQNNPDDPKAFNAWLNATFTAIAGLIDTAPEAADKKLAEAKDVINSLKPESSVGKSQVMRGKLIVTNYEELLALSRVTLADLEKQLAETPEQADDVSLLRKYSRKVALEIGSIARTEPDKADMLMQSARKLTEKLKEAATDKAAKAQIELLERSFASVARSIEHGHELAALIGKPAPALDIQDWANGSPLTADQLKGKVVLLDFWAIWCGPCIATFPHLREWQQNYSDEGLVIIGMTRYYNFKWDDQSGKPMRGKDDGEVSHEDEQAMLKHFAEHHQLQHRFAIQTEDDSQAGDFGVKGIPHVVIIDRQGLIRLIRVGSGPKNATAIHEMIEKLLAEKPLGAQ